jgi:hypothetical protein
MEVAADMHTYIIEDMVKKLRPALKDKARALKILNRYWVNKMALVWDTADVHQAANEIEVALTEKEAVQVLRALHLHYNPQLGLRWEDIAAHITENVLGRKMTKSEVARFVKRNLLTVQK